MGNAVKFVLILDYDGTVTRRLVLSAVQRLVSIRRLPLRGEEGEVHVLGEAVVVEGFFVLSGERSVTRDSRGVAAGEVANTCIRLWLRQILPYFPDSVVGGWWQEQTIQEDVGLGNNQRHTLDPIVRLGGARGKHVRNNLAYARGLILLGGIAAARHDLLCVGRGCFVARARLRNDGLDMRNQPDRQGRTSIDVDAVLGEFCACIKRISSARG